MEALKALGHSLILFLSPLIISVKNLLTPVWERVVCGGKKSVETHCNASVLLKKSRKQAIFSGAVFFGKSVDKVLVEQLLIAFSIVILTIFLAWFLLKILRQLFGNLKVLKTTEKLSAIFSRKSPHNFKTTSKQKKQPPHHTKSNWVFLDLKYPTLAIITVSLFAVVAYAFPERYELANFFRPADTRLASAPTSSSQASAVKGEEAENETAATLKETNPNLYAILNPNPTRTDNLKLGGMLLTRHGELFIATGTVVSDSIKRHTIKSINLGTGAVTSRVIDNGTIQSQDLADSLDLGKLDVEQLSIGSGSPSHFTMRSGDLFVSNRLEVDGDAYFDKTIYVRDSSSISMMTSDTLQTTTANISNILSNSNLHIRGRLPDEDSFHLYDFTNLFLYPSGAVVIGEATVPAFSHIDGTGDLYVKDDLEVGGVIYGTISGAFAPSGNLDMDGNIITNIGNANTDFTASGGLNLADSLSVTGNITETQGNFTLERDDAHALLTVRAANGFAPVLGGISSLGTLASPTPILNYHALFYIQGRGYYDSTNVGFGTQIRM